MSNQQPKKKFTLKKIQKAPPLPLDEDERKNKKEADFKFPLPLYADKYGRKPEALPGLTPVSLPQETRDLAGRELEKAWSEIVERAKKDLPPWLFESSWWACDPKFVCQLSKFRRAVKEALTISITISDGEARPDVVSEWSQRLFNLNSPPNDWTCRVSPGQCVFEPKGLDREHICRVAEFDLVPSFSTELKLPNRPLSPDEFSLAFLRDFITARRSLQVRFEIADLLEKLACAIRLNKKPPSEYKHYPIHHQAAISIVLSWWLKRGGSVKKFPALAEQLMFDLIKDRLKRKEGEEKEEFSEAFARQAKKRLTPDLFWSITIIGNSKQIELDFLSRAIRQVSSGRPIK